MSEDKKNETVDAVPEVSTVPAQPLATAPKLLDADKMALDMAKEKNKTALAEAKAAVANSEKADLTFKYIVLQLYYKYSLSQNDSISENGDIIIGGAVQQPPQGQ